MSKRNEVSLLIRNIKSGTAGNTPVAYSVWKAGVNLEKIVDSPGISKKAQNTEFYTTKKKKNLIDKFVYRNVEFLPTSRREDSCEMNPNQYDWNTMKFCK